MPTLKVMHSIPFRTERATLAGELESIVISGLDAVGERAEVLLILADHVHFGSGAYVEVDCRKRPGRTPEKMKALAGALHERLASELAVQSPRIRIRILMFDEDHAYGVN